MYHVFQAIYKTYMYIGWLRTLSRGATSRVCFSGLLFSNVSFKKNLNGCCIFQRYICGVALDNRVDSADTFCYQNKNNVKKITILLCALSKRQSGSEQNAHSCGTLYMVYHNIYIAGIT